MKNKKKSWKIKRVGNDLERIEKFCSFNELNQGEINPKIEKDDPFYQTERTKNYFEKEQIEMEIVFRVEINQIGCEYKTVYMQPTLKDPDIVFKLGLYGEFEKNQQKEN